MSFQFPSCQRKLLDIPYRAVQKRLHHSKKLRQIQNPMTGTCEEIDKWLESIMKKVVVSPENSCLGRAVQFDFLEKKKEKRCPFILVSSMKITCHLWYLMQVNGFVNCTLWFWDLINFLSPYWLLNESTFGRLSQQREYVYVISLFFIIFSFLFFFFKGGWGSSQFLHKLFHCLRCTGQLRKYKKIEHGNFWKTDFGP